MFNKSNDDEWDISKLGSTIHVEHEIKKSEASEAMAGFMELVMGLDKYARAHSIMFTCTALDLDGEQGGTFMSVALEYVDDFIEMAIKGMHESRGRLSETGD